MLMVITVIEFFLDVDGIYITVIEFFLDVDGIYYISDCVLSCS